MLEDKARNEYVNINEHPRNLDNVVNTGDQQSYSHAKTAWQDSAEEVAVATKGRCW